jgi:hypothetical protein
MSERIPLSNRVRFEIFKRDKFTCQYCGAKAPEVVLQCDHIKPVAEGGTNDILNLITSCAGCNGGKGAVPLSSSAAMDKQRDALACLEERRQQIEMMLEWRDELQSLKRDTVEAIVDRIDEHGHPYTPSQEHRSKIKRWLSRFSVAELLSGIDASFETYADYESDGSITLESWKTAFTKIVPVINMQKRDEKQPHLKRLFYIRGILRNRTGATIDIDYLEYLLECGWSVDFLEAEARRACHIKDFTRPADETLAEEGNPYPGGRPWR